MDRRNNENRPRRTAPTNVSHLLEAAQAGSQQALEQLLESYRSYLRQLAQRGIDRDLRGKIDPSDLAQITLIEAHRDFHGFDSRKQVELQAWLTTLLKNNLADARKHYRDAAKRDVSRELPCDSRMAQVADTKSSPSEPSNPAWDSYQRALGKLPPLYQQVIRLRHAERLSFPQIGTSLDKSADASRMLYGRAIKALKSELENDSHVES